MAKHAVRVAVRNVVKVVTVPARASSVRPSAPLGMVPAAAGRPELLAGVSWDDGRKVWLVHPPGRGPGNG